MAVFVEDMSAYFGSMITCHMGADATEELSQRDFVLRIRAKEKKKNRKEHNNEM